MTPAYADPRTRAECDNGGCRSNRGNVRDSRRFRGETRTRALNAIEAEVCSSVLYCLYDGGTYYRLPVQARYFSPADYQHLTLAGQRALAAAEWKVAQKIIYD